MLGGGDVRRAGPPGLVVERHPNPQDLGFLEGRLNNYNVEKTGVPYGDWLAVFWRDEHSAIVAGLSGWTWGNYLEIMYLWVREDLRGKGLGRQLLAAAEQEARARGCRQAILNTFSFQAPAFYEKLGYTTFGILDNCLDGCTRYYLRKTLL